LWSAALCLKSSGIHALSVSMTCMSPGIRQRCIYHAANGIVMLSSTMLELIGVWCCYLTINGHHGRHLATRISCRRPLCDRSDDTPHRATDSYFMTSPAARSHQHSGTIDSVIYYRRSSQSPVVDDALNDQFVHLAVIRTADPLPTHVRGAR